MLSLIRIFIRKHKDSVRTFAGYCLLYSALFISWESLERPSRISSNSCSDFFLSWGFRNLPEFTFDPIQNPDKNHRKDSVKICSGSCFNSYLFLLCGSLLDFSTILRWTLQEEACWILTKQNKYDQDPDKKYKDLVKIFASLCLECILNLILRILSRFITDPV